MFDAATEHFLKWMYGVHMAAVIQILGPHAYYLRRYGVNPEEDVSTAVDKLNAKAPHLAALLREIAHIALLQ
jgi:hypothetical protein